MPIWQPPASGGGAVATDVIWDTKGDIAAATGADAAVKVAAGADGKMLVADAASSAGVKWSSNLISYTEVTSNTTLTGTTGATATTVITAPAFTANGTDAYLFEFHTPQAVIGATSQIAAALYDGSTFVSVMALVVGPSGSWNGAMSGTHRLVPSAASHTFSLRGYSDSGSGVFIGNVGTGGNYAPCFFRISRDV